MSDVMTFHAVPSGNGALKPEDIVLVAIEDEDSFLAEAGFDAASLEGITQYLTSLGITITELPADDDDEDGIYNQKVAIIHQSSFDGIATKVSEDAQEEHEEEIEYLIEAIAESIEIAQELEVDVAILWR
jgi:hypothetical protein